AVGCGGLVWAGPAAAGAAAPHGVRAGQRELVSRARASAVLVSPGRRGAHPPTAAGTARCGSPGCPCTGRTATPTACRASAAAVACPEVAGSPSAGCGELRPAAVGTARRGSGGCPCTGRTATPTASRCEGVPAADAQFRRDRAEVEWA